MKQLIHTLYITEESASLHLKGEAIEVIIDDLSIAHIPLINLEAIVSMSYLPVSPKLLEKCATLGISFSSISKNGKLKYRVVGITHGNPTLRLLQYDFHNSFESSLDISKQIISAKICNCISLLNKYKYNHTSFVDKADSAIGLLKLQLESISSCNEFESLRGHEGVSARIYFDAFSSMLKKSNELLSFSCRSSNPPKDPCNALLSFSYVLLTNMCIAALESVGLDPYIGFMHCEKSGKPCLALDLIEEMRQEMADRFVLKTINLGIIKHDDFTADNDEIIINKQGLKKFFKSWEDMKHHKINNPSFEEPLELGLLPFYQAQKMARFIYGKDEKYIPYKIAI